MSVSQVIAACRGPLNRGSHLSGDTCHMMPDSVTRSAAGGTYGQVVRVGLGCGSGARGWAAKVAGASPGWGWPGEAPDRETHSGRTDGIRPSGVTASRSRSLPVPGPARLGGAGAAFWVQTLRAAWAPWMAAAALTLECLGTETWASTRRRRSSAGVKSAFVLKLFVLRRLGLMRFVLMRASVPQRFRGGGHGDIPDSSAAGRALSNPGKRERPGTCPASPPRPPAPRHRARSARPPGTPTSRPARHSAARTRCPHPTDSAESRRDHRQAPDAGWARARRRDSERDLRPHALRRRAPRRCPSRGAARTGRPPLPSPRRAPHSHDARRPRAARRTGRVRTPASARARCAPEASVPETPPDPAPRGRGHRRQ